MQLANQKLPAKKTVPVSNPKIAYQWINSHCQTTTATIKVNPGKTGLILEVATEKANCNCFQPKTARKAKALCLVV